MDKLRNSAEWQFFGALYKASPRHAVAWWGLIVARGLLPAAFAVLMGQLINAVRDGRSLAGGLTGIAVVFIATQVSGPIHDTISTNLGARTSAWLHERLLEACVLHPGIAHLENQHLADELAAARDFDMGITGPDITISMPNIGGGFAMLAGGAAQVLLLGAYRWWAPILVGAGWLSTHRFLKKGAIWHGRDDPEVREKQRRADYAYRLNVGSTAAKEVRLFGLADWVVDGFSTLRRELLDVSWEERRLGWRSVRWAVLAVAVTNIVFFWSLARDATNGAVSVGAVVVFAQAAIGAGAVAFGEVDWWFRTSAQPVPLVLGLVGKMAAVGDLPSGTAPAGERPEQEIRFTNVTFSYPGTDRPVLAGFDLTIPAGRSIAIVGQNGAGKTTLAKLLCRLYDPDEGAILADGVDLRELDLAGWRSQVAAVFQDFVRYELSLRDNVSPGGAADDTAPGGAADDTAPGGAADDTAPGGAADDIVVRALAQASAGELADLSTPLSKAYPGGTDLSGGQWQRVAIARALAAVERGARVVLLDEPTAHLDVRAELEVFDRVLDATRGCTTILISHRFGTVRRADLICVVEGGTVIEVGTHDGLMAEGGRYRTMFDLQAARFEDEEALS